MSATPDECAAVSALAAELALGLVGGAERATALAHLDGCLSCRELVDGLARTGDTLLTIVSGVEPGPGFESRVLAALGAASGPTPARERRSPRRPFVVVAAVAAVTLLLAGFLAGRALRPEGDDDLATGIMRTPEGVVVGAAYATGDPAWVWVEVPGWQPTGETDESYELRLDLMGGTTMVVPDVSLAQGSGGWGAEVDVDTGLVRGIALVGSDGEVVCSAALTA